LTSLSRDRNQSASEAGSSVLRGLGLHSGPHFASILGVSEGLEHLPGVRSSFFFRLLFQGDIFSRRLSGLTEFTARFLGGSPSSQGTRPMIGHVTEFTRIEFKIVGGVSAEPLSGSPKRAERWDRAGRRKEGKQVHCGPSQFVPTVMSNSRSNSDGSVRTVFHLEIGIETIRWYDQTETESRL
jgi:hypothetical protein